MMTMTTTQMPWLARVADEAIAVYQRYVSPRKGFRCAHRALHPGRSSCSQYARRVLQRRGFWGGLAPLLLLRRRFKRCGDAAKLLREQHVLDYERRKRHAAGPKTWAHARDRSRWHWTDACDPTPIECIQVPCDGCDLSP